MAFEFFALVKIGLIFKREKLQCFRSKLKDVPEEELATPIEAQTFDRTPGFSSSLYLIIDAWGLFVSDGLHEIELIQIVVIEHCYSLGLLVDLSKLVELPGFGLFEVVLAVLLHFFGHGEGLVEIVFILSKLGTSGVFRKIGLEGKVFSLAIWTGYLLLGNLSFRLLDDWRGILIRDW